MAAYFKVGSLVNHRRHGICLFLGSGNKPKSPHSPVALYTQNGTRAYVGAEDLTEISIKLGKSLPKCQHTGYVFGDRISHNTHGNVFFLQVNPCTDTSNIDNIDIVCADECANILNIKLYELKE